MNYSKETWNKLSKLPHAEAFRSFRIARKILLDEKGKKCEICGSEEKIHVHHKDADILNNSLSNLLIVCQKCHFKEHKLLNIKKTYFHETVII